MTQCIESDKPMSGLLIVGFLRNEFDFCNVHGIMNTLGLLQSLRDNQSIYDSMNIPKIEFIAYIYILLLISKI